MEKRFKRRTRIRDSAELKRGMTIIPSIFTTGNIFCGYFSIVSSLHNRFDAAALAIVLGWVLDGLDGRIARLTKTTSDFGLELDSLADVITFGVAPAMLAFNWGLGSFAGAEGEPFRHINTLGWFATFAFMLCGALRLARFNMQSKKPTETSSKRYFVGLPIPSGAGIIAAIVHYQKAPLATLGSALLWNVLVLLTAFLMVSTVKYHSFKELDLKKRRPYQTLLLVAALIWSVFYYSEYVLLTMAVVYVSSGPVVKLVQTVRRFLPGHHVQPSEPAHGNIRT